ncbi:MAG TPA: bifunctional pyridoxamine 5'-phosphate oxidase family protein/GNAT family N-acetyltransferase [Actinoplanes sp.]|jgi:RimJ/RimL family protein N-acetyltransferase/nitroimidazol reductase NimA-like FMN-containing flavoprotein (pyridoxamine 5'-phosphate oxidase superfamily)
MSDLYPATARTTATRARQLMSYDRATAHAILDEAYDCSVGIVADGEPRVLPTLHVRIGDTLYLHGSSGGRFGLTARGDDGVKVCVSVTLLDGFVYGRSQFHHSANYRSVVVMGVARLVPDDVTKLAVLHALVEKFGVGRAADSRPPSKQELAQTSVLALPLEEVSVRSRTGGVNDETDDLDLPHWAGVLPLQRVAGPPVGERTVQVAPPAYLPGAPRSPWHEAVLLNGEHVRLEPLSPAHVDGLRAVLSDEELWQFLPTPRLTTREEWAAHVDNLLSRRWRGLQVPWAQVDPSTGQVIGMTTYHDIDPVNRSVGIGHTMIGRPWWRTGVNTEAKLLLMARAFDVLGAEKVFWHTDIRNQRSQNAIARLGAGRDGLIRAQRLRPDGTWRDTVVFALTAEEWPAAAKRLRARLAAGPSKEPAMR